MPTNPVKFYRVQNTNKIEHTNDNGIYIYPSGDTWLGNSIHISEGVSSDISVALRNLHHSTEIVALDSVSKVDDSWVPGFTIEDSDGTAFTLAHWWDTNTVTFLCTVPIDVAAASDLLLTVTDTSNTYITTNINRMAGDDIASTLMGKLGADVTNVMGSYASPILSYDSAASTYTVSYSVVRSVTVFEYYRYRLLNDIEIFGHPISNNSESNLNNTASGYMQQLAIFKTCIDFSTSLLPGNILTRTAVGERTGSLRVATFNTVHRQGSFLSLIPTQLSNIDLTFAFDVKLNSE